MKSLCFQGACILGQAWQVKFLHICFFSFPGALAENEHESGFVLSRKVCPD